MTLWLSLALTAMLAVAGFANAQESGCLTVKKISASHHALQQTGNIEVTVKLVTANCGIPMAANIPGKPVDFSVQNQEEFQAYLPVLEINEFDSRPVDGSTWIGHAVTARFTLHAFREASLGKHTIPATLTYSAQDANGNIASHTLALSIPVKVIGPPKPGFWDEHSEARKALVTTGEVLLVIVAIPVLFVGSILGLTRWDC